MITRQDRHLDTQVTQLEADIATASATAHTARQALEAIDTSAAAAEAREQMESAVARLRAAVPPWMQLRLARKFFIPWQL